MIDRRSCQAGAGRKLPIRAAQETAEIAFYAPRRQCPRINTYKAIIATTPNAITYSILLTSLSVVSTINAGVTPTVAATTALLRMKINIILCCDRNVTRMLRRCLYTWTDKARIEVLIHR
jgi:hypothetical protein